MSKISLINAAKLEIWHDWTLSFLALAETACETLELELLQCKDGSFSLFSMKSGIFSAWQLGVGAC